MNRLTYIITQKVSRMPLFGKLMRAMLLVVLMPLQTYAAVNLTDGRIWKAPDHLSLVFDLSGEFDHKLFALTKPSRLVIDIKNTTLKADLKKIIAKNKTLSGSPIKRIRWAKRGKDGLRVVLDMNREVNPRSLPLPPNAQYGHRLMIDLYDKNVKKTIVKKSIDKKLHEKRDIVIALDAGHGGEDPGALGPGRAREKVVVLAIAKELKKLLAKQEGIKAKLVRKGDYYIPLRQRTRLARSYGADLMISIHADSFDNRKAYGASVYALSPRGATSEAARWLARKENGADLIGGDGGLSLGDKDDTLASVLLDLSQTASLKSSLRLGAKVLKSVGVVARLHKRRVEQAGFVVLKSPDIPSILVETGFISNPVEARRLVTQRYQRKMAKAIQKGILAYYEDYPVQGTKLAWVLAKQKDMVVASISSKKSTNSQ